MKRGDLVLCSLSGDYGKTRPAVVIQSDLFNATHASIVICPVTSHEINAPWFRLPIRPHKNNKLEKPSQIMVDKITAVKREKIVGTIGHLSTTELYHINEALTRWLGI
jgi:mRNA interferase MazF